MRKTRIGFGLRRVSDSVRTVPWLYSCFQVSQMSRYRLLFPSPPFFLLSSHSTHRYRNVRRLTMCCISLVLVLAKNVQKVFSYVEHESYEHLPLKSFTPRVIPPSDPAPRRCRKPRLYMNPTPTGPQDTNEQDSANCHIPAILKLGRRHRSNQRSGNCTVFDSCVFRLE